MLSYEQCKKLKDAGFPQTCSEPITCSCGNWVYKINQTVVSGGEAIKQPTLSELIEALKGQFYSLFLLTSNTFQARGAKTFKKIEANHFVMASGDTPEEAVCNLYLKLHS